MSPPVIAVSEQRYARGTAIAAVIVAATWHVSSDLIGTLTGWSDYRWPRLVLVVWVVMAALVVAGSVALLRPGSRRSVWLPGFGIPLLLACVAVVLVAVQDPAGGEPRPGDGAFGPSNWAWTAFGWFALVLLWQWPLRWLLGALVLNSVVVLGTMLRAGEIGGLFMSRYMIVVYITLALQLGLALGARALQRTSGRAAAAAAERADLATAQLAADRVHADRIHRYREMGRAVRQFLAGLASGEFDPAEPAVQRRSAIEAARLRRLIAEHDDTPNPLVHELRACADVAERRDVAVTLETAGPVPDLPLPVRRALIEAPMYLLATARTHARVTVVSTVGAGSGFGEVEVSVVADGEGGLHIMDEVARHDDVEVLWSTEGDSRWVRTRWRHGR
ncbi:MAG: hypothetical protein ACM30G_02915 [Micromonosporaceae bacterium]